MNYILYILFFVSLSATTLQEIYENSGPANGYDKYMELDSNIVYRGGIGIFEGDIYIDCNGAVIDLEDGNGIWIYADEQYPSSLEIKDCSIVNGLYYGVSYGGTSTGKITNCNFIDTNFGVKMFDFTDVIITNSIFGSNQTYGIGIYTEYPILDISYSLFWDNESGDCWESCPGWGNIWTQFELEDNLEIIYNNPLFIDYNNFDFNFNENSPCINSGNPLLFDADGTRSDIGANSFNNNSCNIAGDLNQDNYINVLDIVDMTNCILFNECESNCFDLNEDGEYNVLDILFIVNTIIN